MIACKVRNWFQNLLSKFNLYRYTLEMINCGMKIQALQPLCMLVQRGNERVTNEDESGAVRRNLVGLCKVESS